jgi:uncharacterized membrane protein YkoI
VKHHTLAPKFYSTVLAVCALLTGSLACAAESNGAALLSRLKDSKHSLADGIAQSEKQNGVGISAKFEMKGETLMLSVYTARAGLAKDAEHNELIELIGDAAKPSWSPETEVFEDKQHLTRSAMQLTLVQTSKLSLVEAVKKGEAAGSGTVYSAIPRVKDGRPVYALQLASPQGRSVELLIDGQTGSVVK